MIEVIDSLKTGSYTVTRTAAGSHVAGRFVPGSDSTFSIDAVVQPVRGHELMTLPESRHGEEIKAVFTVTELLLKDKLAIGDDSFEVFRSEKWEAFGDTHWRAYVAKVVE
jgi:hypothetical protein